MVNKLISLFILIIIFGSFYGFYYYFFVLNKGNLTIKSNVDNYIVEMYTQKLKTSFSSKCKNTTCELIDIAPFEYTLTIKKEGYKDFSQDIKINKKETSLLNINLEKQLQVTKINEPLSEENTQSDQLKKFREISSLQKSYKFINLDSLGYFYFIDNNDETLTLYNKKDDNETKIYSFKKIDKNYIDIQKVYQTQESIVIMYQDEKYIYNILSGNIIKIFFPQEISYVKEIGGNYQFVNSKGSFIYDTNSQKIEYFYTFKDFIEYDRQNYFGIIYQNEIDKKKNYNLEEYKGNLIVKYNFESKKVKVLESISENIIRIVIEDGEIYFYNDIGNKFLVNNIE